MPSHIETLDVPYAPEDMFQLVAGIADYPKFIKWIKALRVSQPQQVGSRHMCIGEAVVGFKGFTERFSTSVEADSAECTVKVRLVRGPFRRLVNNWAFRANDAGGTAIRFEIDYEFSNMVLRALASSNQDRAVDKIMESFLIEADRRFRTPPGPGPTTGSPVAGSS
ncbi:MAG: type II toxin-antitoxin system RatA family toxin [Pseudomonadota bacterium]